MLQTLELTNIRSYASGLFEFSGGVNIIVGPNASGKTNLLEAIYMSSMGSAFKSDDQHMVARDSDWGRIDAHYDTHPRSIKLQGLPIKKTYIINDIEKKQFRADSYIPTVLFEPSHMLLLSSEPDRRRSYIDTILTQTEPSYGPLLKDYKRTLAQRNKLLKQENITAEHMFVWDLRLSEMAGKVVDYRVQYINYLQEQLTENYRSVSGNDEEDLRINEDQKKFQIYNPNKKFKNKIFYASFRNDISIKNYTSLLKFHNKLQLILNDSNDINIKEELDFLYQSIEFDPLLYKKPKNFILFN